MTQQIGNPFRVLHVGLAAWDLLHVLGVGDYQFERSFEDSENGFPINTRAFHRHVGTAF
jgi:hypothetical protein